MGLREYYQQDAARWLEVTCGIALLAFSGLSGFVAILGVVQSNRYPRALIATAIFGLIAWGLLRLGFRLLQRRHPVGRALLSPTALIAGAVVFLVGGILLISFAIIERDFRFLILGLGNLPASYFSFKLALERRRQSVPPNKSLERTREE
jgi:hypothetical protein